MVLVMYYKNSPCGLAWSCPRIDGCVTEPAMNLVITYSRLRYKQFTHCRHQQQQTVQSLIRQILSLRLHRGPYGTCTHTHTHTHTSWYIPLTPRRSITCNSCKFRRFRHIQTDANSSSSSKDATKICRVTDSNQFTMTIYIIRTSQWLCQAS